MARKTPTVISSRVTDGEAVRVDLASRIRGVTKSEYVRKAVVERAKRDLERIGRPDDRDS